MNDNDLIHPSFPSQGTVIPNHVKSELAAKLSEAKDKYGSASSQAYRRGDYSSGTYSPWHPNEQD